MNKFIFPTDRQLVRALANAIATHRDVVNSQIYFPFIEGDRNIARKIPMAAVRTFAGTEYIEDGLTMAVYLPNSDMGVGKAITYTDSHLGRPSDNYDYLNQSEVRVIVHLYYREPSYNAPAIIQSRRSSYLHEITKIIPYGRYLQYEESEPNELLPVTPLEERHPPEHFVEDQTLEISILPGEEVLRDWMSLLRGVIRDLPELRPFAVRDPTILSVNYETPDWEKNNKMNLVFHSAYMVITYKMYEPRRPSDFEFPMPPEFNLSATIAPVGKDRYAVNLLDAPKQYRSISDDDDLESNLIM
jgi:hypothetical protein